jgi:hypothetical protein
MSASIELTFDGQQKLLVPIVAINHAVDRSFVRIRDKNAQLINRPVITGKVYGEKVVIDAGLSVGDEIVYE